MPVSVAPSPGGVPTAPPALTCMWLLRAGRGAAGQAFGDALGLVLPPWGAFPGTAMGDAEMGSSRTLRRGRDTPGSAPPAREGARWPEGAEPEGCGAT